MDATVMLRPIPFDTDLDAEPARDPSVTGSKAASLATARAGGMDVLPGFAVTTAAHAAFLSHGHHLPPDVRDALRPAWSAISNAGALPLVVRSSSTVEDIGASSMAGRFRSMLDVRGWDGFLDAVVAVFSSADEVGGAAGPSPMGVLVQAHLVPRCGGVMFGVDPVTGETGHVVIEAIAGGPDALVSGRVSAEHYVVSPRGRLLSVDHHPVRRLGLAEDRLLSRHEARALAGVAEKARHCFGSPQDIEWAIDTAGEVLLLQSRPVTATGTLTEVVGPVLGPGPVAETFPAPLGTLETDLWITPLRHGVSDALTETRTVTPDRLDHSPVVTTIDGRVCADLELFGYVPQRHTWSVLDPRPGIRRLTVAWHTGRIRAQLPQEARALLAEVDQVLGGTDLQTMEAADLLNLLEACRVLLRRLHRAEVLASTLLPAGDLTAASVALGVLARQPRSLRVDELVSEHPVLLSLSAPAIGCPVTLPPMSWGTHAPPSHDLGDLAERESLRLRVRWVHELTARAAWRLGTHLVQAGLLPAPEDVTMLSLDELVELSSDGGHPPQLHERRRHMVAAAFAPPLPARFRLTPDGRPVPVERTHVRPGSGVGAGGGRGVGPVVHASARRPPAPGDVLVVRELAPQLAGWLPGLGGLVTETGGVLSHLAILAREYQVPVAVGVHDALRRFPPGVRVVVDGTTGEVDLVDAEQPSRSGQDPS